MYYIRADANEKIGTGHVMRCLSIAEELRRHGESVTFITADERSRGMIEEQGFSIICLNSMWNDLEKEISSLIRVIKAQEISSLLIDSYFVTEAYLKEIGKYTKIIYIDDINQFLYPVDLLVNYNIYAGELEYEKRYREAGLDTKFLLGCSYVPLREEFCCIDRKISETVSRVLITSGGTDSWDAVGGILETFAEKQWFGMTEFHVILGRFNKNREKLEKRWEDHKNVVLLSNIKNMAEQMKQCDIAVTAGGVTTYELCAVGIPSVMYTLADNQMDIANTVSRLGIIPWVGDIRENRERCLEMIGEYIEKFRDNLEIRQNLSREMRSVVDGKGCTRFVDAIWSRLNI